MTKITTLDITDRKDAAKALPRLVNNMAHGDILIYRRGLSNWDDKRPEVMIAAKSAADSGKARMFQRREGSEYVYMLNVV